MAQPLFAVAAIAAAALLLPAGIQEQNVGAVVQIVVYDSLSQPSATGSGTIIDAEGDILTNYHVMEPAIDNPGFFWRVLLTDDVRSVPLPGLTTKLVAVSKAFDLALLRATGFYDKATRQTYELQSFLRQRHLYLPHVAFDRYANSEGVSLGDDIQVLGYPGVGGETITFTKGTVSGFAPLRYHGRDLPWRIKTDANINSGSSGGAAFDSRGNFVGVPVAVTFNRVGRLGYVISLPVVDLFLSQNQVATEACRDQVNGYADASGKCFCNQGFHWKGAEGRCVPSPNLVDGRYTLPSEGVVHDARTGLTWQRTTAPGWYTWGRAMSYCRTLRLAGGGWRLPSRRELDTLLASTSALLTTKIDAMAFPNTPIGGIGRADWFWTSSPVAGTSSFMWGVNFGAGGTSGSVVGSTGKVRCVR